MSSEERFLATLRATFRVEADEHLQTISSGLLALEKASAPEQQRPLIDSIFRAAHSLKGGARAVSFGEVESICQSLEDLFASWKKGTASPSGPTLDTAHRALDAVAAALATPKTADETPIAPVSRAEPATQTVRVAIDKLDTCLLEAEEMLAAKLALNERAAELRSLRGDLSRARAAWSKFMPQLRAAHTALAPAGFDEFLESNHDQLQVLEGKFATLYRAAERDRLTLGRLIDDLLADSKKLVMLPLATLGAPLPKLVRDLCRDQGKQAELAIRGEDVEIDKRILEEMKDALMHLLRNCIDHGIETPDRRNAAGKPPRATITLDVSSSDGNQVQIVIADDGAGIDVERVKSAAIERGLLAPDSARRLPDREALALIFEADLSTSPVVTQLSGRGLGLAIVREKVEKLGGAVTVESRSGAGTTFRVRLPVTLATFRGVLVSAAERSFVLPTLEVERVLRFKPADVQTVEGRETLVVHGRTLPLLRLADVLALPLTSAGEQALDRPAVVLGTGEQRMAFAVDTVLGEHEVLIKQLAKPLVRVRYVSGATILGSGQVVPVLRVADLLRFAKELGAPAQVARAAPAAAPAQSILLVEDSITSRLLLKGILESAGYRVRATVDGMEAFAVLRTETFDLVVSDVEMPRLNGFDLTARIRADRKLAELPVILVTALESREDRERGAAVGADAYLVKSSFEQSNLLEAVRRLI